MQNIAVIGSGYIGLVIGSCLAEFGNKIIFADIDAAKIKNLQNGILPIFEPGLDALFIKNLSLNKIVCTTDIAYAIRTAQIIFIAVNTPTGFDGKADISAIKQVAQIIGQNLNEEKIICIKSTVNIGTHKIVQEIIDAQNPKFKFEVASIPEFLRQASAVHDFMNPDRIIVGTKSEIVFQKLKDLFSQVNCHPERILKVDNSSAETIKYISNSFLALKVSFANEMAKLCDTLDLDSYKILNAVGLDNRIGQSFLRPGPGFGGSCFPKDILALLSIAKESKIDLQTIKTTLHINDLQKDYVVQKINDLLDNDLKNKKIAILGLAFKANTDDIRQSCAIDIIKKLQSFGATINAYDPKAMQNMSKEISDINYCSDAYECATNADCLLVLTEWEEFKKLDYQKIYNLMRSKIIYDTRNILNWEKLKAIGFQINILGKSIKNHNFSKKDIEKFQSKLT